MDGFNDGLLNDVDRVKQWMVNAGLIAPPESDLQKMQKSLKKFALGVVPGAIISNKLKPYKEAAKLAPLVMPVVKSSIQDKFRQEMQNSDKLFKDYASDLPELDVPNVDVPEAFLPRRKAVSQKTVSPFSSQSKGAVLPGIQSGVKNGSFKIPVTVNRKVSASRGRKNAKPVLMEKKSAGSPETGSGFFGRLFGKSVPEKKTSYLSWNKILGKNVLPGKTAGSAGLAGAAKEAGVVDDNSAWETFRKIRDSVNEVPYPQYRGLKNIEKHNEIGDAQNRLILNREAQEERELVAKQWEWKRKYGSQRDMLKRELMGKILGVAPDSLAPEPYPVGKKDKKGVSVRDVHWARARQMGEAGFKADTLDAAESGRRMTTAGTLTDHEMGRKAELQNRKAQIDADKDIKTLNSGYNLEGKKYQVDAEKEKYVAGYMMKIASERNDKVKDYMSRYDRMTPADQAKIGDGRSWAAEMADQDITRAYGTTLKMLERMQ